MRRMGYIWRVGPVFCFLNGGLGEPVWTTILGLCWVGFLSWVCFREAKKIEAKVLNNVAETTHPAILPGLASCFGNMLDLTASRYGQRRRVRQRIM